jgi:hypothetical protein
MRRFLAAALVGLTIAATFSTSASAFHCVARSSNGASGWANRIILERAQAVAMRTCIVAGGNLHGHFCHIAYCR